MRCHSLLKSILASGLFAVAFPALADDGAERTNGVVEVTVSDAVTHRLDIRLFGQFMERASWSGETGPEGAAGEDGNLPTEIVERLEAMRIPIVRFPGGADVDYLDWTDSISNVPGRGVERPDSVVTHGDKITNRFGLDEYLALAERLGWQNLIVVNFLDGLSGEMPLDEAVRHAAGMVAYCNTKVGNPLPDGMIDWPAVRAANGRRAPYGVRIFQLGNEWFIPKFAERGRAGAKSEDPEVVAAWYRKCVLAFIEGMREVDPDIEIMIDGDMGGGIEEAILSDDDIRREVRHVTFHAYAPGPMGEIEGGGPSGGLSDEDWFFAWASMPGSYGEEGMNVSYGGRLDLARELDYSLAATEWNWNGWGFGQIAPKPRISWRRAAALGTAGFLHGMLRQGGTIKIATQSMLVGEGWDIAGLRYQPGGKGPVVMNAQSAVVDFYHRHHGEELLETTVSGLRFRSRPFKIGWAEPQSKIATLDVLTTRMAGMAYVHFVNRALDRDERVVLDLRALEPKAGESVFRTLRVVASAEEAEANGGWTRVQTEPPVPVSDGMADLVVPAGSVGILEVAVGGGAESRD